ncbi:MAG: hypothetical protein KGQ36_04000 [Rickettsiales bacterium]|nr:hypothetical protein [Rickettsiales bacterium]
MLNSTKTLYPTRPYPIYKKIEGKLVKIDKRDPNRDYSCVSGEINGERIVYDLELTDEEQEKKNNDEAKNESERPMREAEAKIQSELQRKKNTEFRKSLEYETRLVAFLDILGWRSAIEESSSNTILAQNLGIALTIFPGMKQQNEFTKGWFEYDPQISHFSDSIVISVKFDRNGIDYLLRSLGWVVDFFLEKGLLVRGGISCGLLTHKENMVYGPALIKAYDLERNKDNWAPRIVLDEELVSLIGKNIPMVDLNNNLLGYIKDWRIDAEDGKTFFDFLPHPSLKGEFFSVYERTLTITKNMIQENIEKFKNKKNILRKYQWLAQYLNTVIEELPEIKVEKILL